MPSLAISCSRTITQVVITGRAKQTASMRICELRFAYSLGRKGGVRHRMRNIMAAPVGEPGA